MKAVEASAKTREEAIQKALQDLGVEMYEVDKIEIIDEGSKGFLGFGARPVRVRLIVEKLHEEPRRREERGRGDRPGGDRSGGDRPARAERGGDRPERGERGGNRRGGRKEREAAPAPKGDRPPRGERAERSERPARPDRPERKPADASATPKEGGDGGESPDRGDRPRRRRGGRGGRGRRGGGEGGGSNGSAGAPGAGEVNELLDEEALELQAAANAPMPKDEAEVAAIRAAEEAANAPLSDEQGQEGATLLQAMIEKMGISATVAFGRGEDGGARLTVESEDGALLIGRKGRNLSAMQYLVNRMISRGDTAENTERLVVDVEGYVDRRRQALEELARDQAVKAKEGRRTIRLKPMSPWERRIIHLVLQNDEGVRTFSLGESLYRSVVIASKDAEPDRVTTRGSGGGRGGERGPRGEGRGEGRGGRDRDRPDRAERRPRSERPERPTHAGGDDDDFENDGSMASKGVARPKGLPRNIAPVIRIRRDETTEAPVDSVEPESTDVVTRPRVSDPEPSGDGGPRGARPRRGRQPRRDDFDAGAISD